MHSPNGTPPFCRRQLLDWHGCTSHDSTDDWLQPLPISLTADTHFAARLGAFFYRTRFTWSTVYRSTIPLPIYLINLPWKLGLGLGLDLKTHYFSIFHRE